MGLRIRKSVKLAPGVRLNFGKKTGSVSVGGKGIYYNVKTYGGKKKQTSSAGCLGPALFWLFIGWWWWPLRLVCYDLPKYIFKRMKKPEA